MEKFDLRKSSSQAKSLGTIVAVSGAFVMTLYKGPPLLMATLPSNLPHRLLLSQEQPNWVLGGLFLGISCLSSSIWNIVQTATIEEYPDEITVVFFYCFFGTIQCTIFSLIAERNPTAWILTPGVEMISIVFSREQSKEFTVSCEGYIGFGCEIVDETARKLQVQASFLGGSKPKSKPKKEKTEEERKFRRRAKYFLVTQLVAVLVFLSLLGGSDDAEVELDDDDSLNHND